MRSHSSRGNWSIVTRWASVLTPALLTRMSSRPDSATTGTQHGVDLVGSVTSSASRARVGCAAAAALTRRLVDVGVDDPAAVGRQTVGDRLADAPGGAGDEADLAGQIAFHRNQASKKQATWRSRSDAIMSLNPPPTR